MSKTRIMVVEDERIVALNLKQRLVKLGYDVCALATSGEEALRMIENNRPDVVLMDINIEGDIDGIETACKIPPETHTPIIYLTAYSEESTLERARATKPYGYLLKPFSERELHATIQMVLARSASDKLLLASEKRLEKLVEERTEALKVTNHKLQEQIEERARTEAALLQAQKMEAIGQLTGGIAHDFNNLLQGIGGSLSLLQRRVDAGRYEEAGKYIAAAISSTQRAASLTQRLLAFSRRQALSPKPLDCGQLVKDLHELLSRTMGEMFVVEIEAEPDLWLTKCDGGQLESAVINLTINARDAMPHGGKFKIAVSNVTLSEADLAGASFSSVDGSADKRPASGEYVRLCVTDSGVGMSRETVAHAFDPFFTTKPTGQGTGLGLSMVYGFARQSKGLVKISSEVNEGTTVSLYLPRLAGEHTAERVAHVAATTTFTASASGKIILVVEDDAIIRSLILEVLKELGHQSLEAFDGPSGLEILKAKRPIDLLVTDIGLPGLNGRQVADGGRIVHPDLKVLFMTGYAESAAAEGFLEQGMEIMAKPFTWDMFADRIKQMTA